MVCSSNTKLLSISIWVIFKYSRSFTVTAMDITVTVETFFSSISKKNIFTQESMIVVIANLMFLK